jgi:hypothetical protein
MGADDRIVGREALLDLQVPGGGEGERVVRMRGVRPVALDRLLAVEADVVDEEAAGGHAPLAVVCYARRVLISSQHIQQVTLVLRSLLSTRLKRWPGSGCAKWETDWEAPMIDLSTLFS